MNLLLINKFYFGPLYLSTYLNNGYFVGFYEDMVKLNICVVLKMISLVVHKAYLHLLKTPQDRI